jgi:hypothetical protein
VTPGTTLEFGVTAFNSFAPQTGDAHLFHATVRTLVSGCTALGQRDVVILVPPSPQQQAGSLRRLVRSTSR